MGGGCASMNLFDVKFSAIQGAPNILYLDDDANVITEQQFEKELKAGYRGAMLLIPIANAVQLQVAMVTPYHKDHYQLDFGFVVANYNEFQRKKGEDALLNVNENEFYMGEIEYA
jgi:hypothetical protein